MISPTRRSAIPISTSGARRLMARSLSRSRDTLLDSHQQQQQQHQHHQHQLAATAHQTHGDDLHTFTLLEENIALKESCEQLSQLHTTQQQLHTVLNAQLAERRSQCDRLQSTEVALRAQLQHSAGEQQRLQAACVKSDALVAGLLQRLHAQDQQHAARLTVAGEETAAATSAAAASATAVARNAAESSAELAAVRVQLTGTELQLYEANEKIAELAEELGRTQTECACVTEIAGHVLGDARVLAKCMDADALRKIKSQHDIYARVARATTAESRSLLAALQLMETVVDSVGGQPQHQQEYQQQQQQHTQPRPTTIDVNGDGGMNGRIVQMMPKYSTDTGAAAAAAAAAAEPAPVAAPVRPMRPPPPPIPPRHFSTTLATGSRGQDNRTPYTVNAHYTANQTEAKTATTTTTNADIDNGVDDVVGPRPTNGAGLHEIKVQQQQHQAPAHPLYVHMRSYQTPMATGMDALMAANATESRRQQRRVDLASAMAAPAEDTIFV